MYTDGLSVEQVSIAHFVFAVAAEAASLMSGFPPPPGFRFLEYFSSVSCEELRFFSSQEVHAVQSCPDMITINQC